ncbi:hypothetical protein ES702_03930 [subsurface metagenome]
MEIFYWHCQLWDYLYQLDLPSSFMNLEKRGKKLKFNLNPKTYLFLFLISGIAYIFYNELVILPYQSWTPETMTTMYAMSLRNPLINLFLTLTSFGIMCYGTIVFVAFIENSNGYGYEGILTDQSTMKDSQKGG